MPITSLPDAPSRGDQPAVFVAKADAFLASLSNLVTEMNAVIGVVNLKGVWVSGTTYTAYTDVVISPIDFNTYRRKTNGAGTTDPSLDTTNWTPASEITGKAIQSQTYTAFTTAGTAPAFTLTPSPAIPAYAAGQRFRAKFNAGGTTGSNTLNVSGKGAVNIKQYDSTGAKVSGVVVSGQLADVEYDGTDFVILDPLPPQTVDMQSITATVSANALTVGLNPTSLTFRSSTLSSGTPVTRTVSSALSLTVPSGATLGTVSGQSARLVVLAIDNAGTVELAITNFAGGLSLDESGTISTTAMSAAASSANVIYSTTGRTGVAYRVVGFLDITESAAGTWASAPTKVQPASAGTFALFAGTGVYSAGTYYQSIYPAVFSDAGDGVAGVTASSVVLGESSTIGQFGSPGTVYVERLNVRMLASGTFRVSFGLGRASGTAGARIYKNGVAFGTDRSTTTGTVASPVTFTEDLAFTAGDTLQIFMKNTASANTGIFAPKIGVSVVPTAPIFNTIYVGER